MELDESGVLPLEFEVLPVDPDSDVPDAPVLDPVVPVVPVLPDIPGDEEPEPAEESELPDPSVLVLPEGEREVLLLLRPCAFPDLLEVLDPVLLPVSAVDEVSDPEVPRELPELPWDRSDPCDAVSDDDPEPDEPEPVDDCPLVPEPVPEPDDCATAAPAIASAPAPINVPNQRLSLIQDTPALTLPSTTCAPVRKSQSATIRIASLAGCPACGQAPVKSARYRDAELKMIR